MRNKIKYAIIPMLAIVASCSLFKDPRKPSTPLVVNKDSTSAVVKPKVPQQLQAFEKIVTKEAKSTTGMFNIHRVDQKYFFEIPDSLLGREILVVTRFSKTPVAAPKYGGEAIGERMVYWEKGPTGKMFLRVATVISVADSTDAIARAVNNANVSPIVEAFEIKARNMARASNLIEVTDWVNSDNVIFSLATAQKDELSLAGLEKDKSYIDQIRSYPSNIEVKAVKTYKAKVGPRENLPAAVLSGMITIEVNTSMVLLPKIPMKKRFFDERVGYFATANYDYSDIQQKVAINTFIKRWRLEPRAEDLQRWKNGELVEPKKPIVFYIDPATPEKWIDYLIKGVNDWQSAFQSAGFKNAIVGKRWEAGDSLSLEDSRFSVIRYFASPIKNAYGPAIVDPRSGEIMESHIGWYHNVMSLLSSWYMIQAGPSDPRGRKMEMDQELMGELIRFVSSHEVGHTLGLRHNMGASSATPVEKLRDPAWLKKNGHTASIMDYARFNYVAQPQDNIPTELLMPRINDYDKWAIKWGYSGTYGDFDAQKEKQMLSKQVTDSLEKNPRLWFGGEGKDYDPRSQAEDLGDDAVVASTYGIQNLKRIIPELKNWTKVNESDDYSNLDERYDQVVAQYSRYIKHVLKNIGGIYVTPKTYAQSTDIYESVPRAKQKAALSFLGQFVFQEPTFLVNNDILNKIQLPQAKNAFNKELEGLMMSLISGSRISRMNYIAERYEKGNPYRSEEFIQDLNKMIWRELDQGQPVSSYRRSLQLIYLDNMILVYNPKKATGIQAVLAMLDVPFTSYTDVATIALNDLVRIQQKIKKAIPKARDQQTKAHLQYMDRQLTKALALD